MYSDVGFTVTRVTNLNRLQIAHKYILYYNVYTYNAYYNNNDDDIIVADDERTTYQSNSTSITP